MTDLTTALIALAVGVLGGFVTWTVAERRIAAEHVTAERAKWRKKVRRKALEVHDTLLLETPAEPQLFRLRMEFGALLNPHDREDRGILNCIEAGDPDGCPRDRAREFGDRIALLLKHDWQRVKLEAGFFLWRWMLRARRCPYQCQADGTRDRTGRTEARTSEPRAGHGLRACLDEWRSWRRDYEIRCGLLAAVGAVAVGAGLLWFGACSWAPMVPGGCPI